jgi:hypothetical protein
MKTDQTSMSMQGGGYYNDNSTLQRKAIDTYLTTFQPVPFESMSTYPRYALLS